MAEYNTLAFMLDCSRNAVVNLTFLKRLIDLLSDMGYNELQLYTEDTLKIDGEPYFGYLRGGFSKKEISEIDEYCAVKGINLVPCIQTLAHLDRIFRWQKYNAAVRDFGDVLLADREETYRLIEKEFCQISQCFRSKKVNLGMDEAHMLGLGRHLKEFGYENPREIFFRHLHRVLQIAKKYGFEAYLWSDMFIKYDNDGAYSVRNPKISQSAKDVMPAGVNLIYWDYNLREKQIYRDMLEAHEQLGARDVTWAAACWSFLGMIPRNDYGIAAQKAAFPVMKAQGVKNYMLTFWGDDGAECSKLALLPTIFHFAEMAKGNFDEKKIARKFKDKFGVGFYEYLFVDLPNRIGDAGRPADVFNPAKYMLYNDCFLGVYDVTVDETLNAGKKYASYAKKLHRLADDRSFGYMFDAAAKLCKVLAFKYEIGVKTRKIYKAGDRGAARNLLAEYDKIIKNLQSFYISFKRQWDIENKAFGFEVQAARVGGLLQRVKDCREKLAKWVLGEIEKIEELEEEIDLDVYGRETDEKCAKQTVVANVYHDCITTGY